MRIFTNRRRKLAHIGFHGSDDNRCDQNNLRKDHDRVSDWVFDKEPDFKPFEEGTVKLDREDWEKSLDMWYEAMGWNKETGIPTRETLEKFDLGDCADKLEELGLI